ncbi:hypothetical protein [Vibrio cholerae]|uniref:hypothetical protein n=1 Tax=Vibrio cholerae TaxID=666 RepID=UPI00067FAC4A|nr:hypothetical protein [Vibrio cholerae]
MEFYLIQFGNEFRELGDVTGLILVLSMIGMVSFVIVAMIEMLNPNNPNPLGWSTVAIPFGACVFNAIICFLLVFFGLGLWALVWSSILNYVSYLKYSSKVNS